MILDFTLLKGEYSIYRFKRAQLNTSVASFFGFDWANRSAVHPGFQIAFKKYSVILTPLNFRNEKNL